MVGFLISDEGKNGFDKDVIPDRLCQYSSIMQLHVDSNQPMEELMRGDNSIGGLCSGYDVIPSPTQKNYSGASSFFKGSYSLRRCSECTLLFTLEAMAALLLCFFLSFF